MSAVAMEGASLDTEEQFTLAKGYGALLKALVDELPPKRVTLQLETPVREIAWRHGNVRVATARGEFSAAAAIITVPLGVLQAAETERGALRFDPPLRQKRRLLSHLKMGHVIRVTLRFDARAWRRLLPKPLQGARGGFGFIHSRLKGVPVWWALSNQPVLTGWAGGPAAEALDGKSTHQITEQALSSLSRVFDRPKADLRGALRDVATHNWSRDPFSRGAYSFVRAGYDDAPEKLRAPVRDTLFFAGEAMADGEEIGTVPGALNSGLRAAVEVRAALRGRVIR
jgi:monoamine oxidase